MQLHHVQLEYELREKLILLRQSALSAAGDAKRLWELLLRSLPAFTTLFRHTLIALGESVPESQRSALQAAFLAHSVRALPRSCSRSTFAKVN